MAIGSVVEPLEKTGATLRGTRTEPVSREYAVFSGSANPALTEEICAVLECPPGAAMIRRFADNEIYLQIQENVRGMDVFVACSWWCSPFARPSISTWWNCC